MTTLYLEVLKDYNYQHTDDENETLVANNFALKCKRSKVGGDGKWKYQSNRSKLCIGGPRNLREHSKNVNIYNTHI